MKMYNTRVERETEETKLKAKIFLNYCISLRSRKKKEEEKRFSFCLCANRNVVLVCKSVMFVSSMYLYIGSEDPF